MNITWCPNCGEDLTPKEDKIDEFECEDCGLDWKIECTND